MHNLALVFNVVINVALTIERRFLRFAAKRDSADDLPRGRVYRRRVIGLAIKCEDALGHGIVNDGVGVSAIDLDLRKRFERFQVHYGD